MRQQFFIPLSIILRVLVDKPELEIFEDIRRGSGESLSLEEAAMRSLMSLRNPNYNSKNKALSFLGQHFRNIMRKPSTYSDMECGQYLVKQYIAIHVDESIDKYHVICGMFRKLHALVCGTCCRESNDSLMFQEILLPGTLYMNVLRDKLMCLLRTVGEKISIDIRRQKDKDGFKVVSIQQYLNRHGEDVANGLQYFLATGNFPATNYYPLVTYFNGQSAGLVVPADNINFLRLAAQFRSVHRGATFADSRTTDVRKLLPEAYGFICPVHTPDGAPCGLLNHLADPVTAVTDEPSKAETEELAKWLQTKKLRPLELMRQLTGSNELHGVISVSLNGRILGWSPSLLEARMLERELRALKISQTDKRIPHHMEVCLVPPTRVASQYPGLYIFTSAARLIRPVYSLARTNGALKGADIEWIGPFEMPYLDIPVTEKELLERPPEHRKHMEIKPEALFSLVASLTPYPDFNQSPRNMYQCQMVKQSMGHPSYLWRYRSDAKMYRLLEVQAPLVRTKNYDKYQINDYPLGFNAVVAVMSYTGYDMEDAMIINKGSYERGFANACIYKSELIDLGKASDSRSKRCNFMFGTENTSNPIPEGLDWDGFPNIGCKLYPKRSALYCYTNLDTNRLTTVYYEGLEEANVESVSLNGCRYKATITLRLQRRPDIGDKYSSRHGQKGVNSLLVPVEEMPWSVQSGIVPDILFNPHGFPTRMTMGMMVEFLAGKSAAVHARTQDATPFQWGGEEHPPYLDYAQQLLDAGYNYWGSEMLMCGSTGRQLEAHIFMGVVYYQRLRHMVADKYQVRSTGRFEPILRQPLKGRKVQGGMRLGEMERDGLLSHGAVFTLQDRFVESNCDRVFIVVCNYCRSVVHTQTRKHLQCPNPGQPDARRTFDTQLYRCLFCRKRVEREEQEQEAMETEDSIVVSRENQSSLRVVAVTAAFRYLVYELALMNLRTVVDFEDIS